MAKVELLTSAQMGDEVVLISVNDVPLSDLMDRIATVTSGEWKQEGPSYMLVSAVAVRRQQEREATAKRLAEVKSALANRERQMKKQVDGAANEESVITKRLAKIDSKELAQMERGDRIVFATNPTPTQRSLGDKDASLANDLVSANGNRRGVQWTTTVVDQAGNIYGGHLGTSNP